MNIEKILDKLLKLPTENEVVEFKKAENQFDKDKLGQYFSALSNEANLKNLDNAWMVMGVDNDKNIIGTKISDRQINEYKEEVSKHTSPKCSFTDVHKVIRDGKVVLLFEIPATSPGMPMSWKGHRYGRDGESLGALSDFEYDSIKSQIQNEDWSAQIIEEASLSDLSEDAIAKAKEEYTRKNPKLKDEIISWSNETFLNKAKITIKSKITNTAIVLLGKTESEHFISPAVAKITWVLKDKENIEKDYQHFSCPFILAVEDVALKIRNLKYRYIKDTLFPEEVDQYDPYIIREALNNAIAHQDYRRGGKIIVVENEDGILNFSNSGKFIPKSVEYVITQDVPEEKYRNRFLSQAMVSLNMIDTIGSGIKKMFNIQKNKLFPLPDYDLSNDKVLVSITGKVVDLNFSRKIAQMPNLTLEEILYLDKVAKHKILEDNEAVILKKKNLIEGRKPNYYISSNVANVVQQKDEYIKLRGLKDSHYKNLILEYLDKYKQATKDDIDKLIIEFLPNILTPDQKANKMRNIIYSMSKKDESIKNHGTNRNPIWKKLDKL